MFRAILFTFIKQLGFSPYHDVVYHISNHAFVNCPFAAVFSVKIITILVVLCVTNVLVIKGVHLLNHCRHNTISVRLLYDFPTLPFYDFHQHFVEFDRRHVCES